ncbi:murein transglycosylase A [Roseospirillum parvum]|uniref:peptidoglycan lytic exotransglycosylase n=1 Tax=Roseospirillum parvum TaxID=83401 RepID=A0A1G8DKR0_9PROT|nr:MltA domain-containing protein [Roseospirillum parvum]SDH58283.1 membrane-bound lytic murein transglycosylase A [Roseospirillum parvum]
MPAGGSSPTAPARFRRGLLLGLGLIVGAGALIAGAVAAGWWARGELAPPTLVVTPPPLLPPDATPPEPLPEDGAPPNPLALIDVPIEVLPGWAEDDLGGLSEAFSRSCARLEGRPADTPLGSAPLGSPNADLGTIGDWRRACAAVLAVPADDADALRRRLAETFTAHLVFDRKKGRDHGLFTGYYEAELNAAPTRHGPYQSPIHGRPPDLVSLDLEPFSEELAGQRIIGRVEGDRFVPYPARAAIDAGALPETTPVVLWADDPVDVFFLHIQGSARVRLPDGTTRRIGYAANNGHRFVGIGSLMRQRGLLKDLSMQTIRDWLRAHPDTAAELMAENPRYIFFREIDGEGPIGAQGVPLTPLRSLAVDRRHIPLGALVWLDTTQPDGTPLSRLMVAQDVGGAIKGVIRGDVFWGTGEAALKHAGGMAQQGRVFVLRPR